MQEDVLPTGKSSDPDQPDTEQKCASAEIVTSPVEFDVQVAETLSDDVENGGTIERWKSLEVREKLKMRAFLTYSTVSVWELWTLIGLIDYLATGNPFLLVTSPPVGGLLFLIFKFYFK